MKFKMNSESEFELDFSNFPKGIYLLRINSEVFKLIKI